jgi:cyclomaltodextrinase / maltogenic alpha-amylase / neopullulanase
VAKNSPLSLRQLFIYQIYLRNHNESGTFKELIADLDRIKELGADFIYFLPVHPVGQKNKKGSLGCNYSIQDYRAISEEHGTMEDFQTLIEEAHKRGLKVMMDIVYNHTSHDAKMLDEHPEWYFYRNGKTTNRVGDWSDIIDLDYNKRALWDYQIQTLEFYAKMGVDGYRCDVAPLIPLDFWMEARERISHINRDFVWLSESVHKSFIKYIRDMGFDAHSDGEVYQAFDILYDYDIFDHYTHYLEGKGSLKTYLDEIRNQEMIYPNNYTKLRNLENHDQPRVASFISDRSLLKNWTAFIFFLKGATMIYAGQEAYNTNRPSLFDIDKVDWSHYLEDNCDDLIKQMAKLKKDPIMANGIFNVLDYDAQDVIVLTYKDQEKTRYGIFNVSEGNKTIKLNIPNDTYTNLIDSTVIDYENELMVSHNPMVFDVTE